jgi:hypothetical protein
MEEAYPREIIASTPGDIQIIVYGETFSAKRLKKGIISRPGVDIRSPTYTDCCGCVEIGDWISEDKRRELRKLMSFPGIYPTTVFQIVVNVPPACRLICEWPHEESNIDDKYYFTQLIDLSD